MSLDPLTAIIDAGKTVLNKFVADKMPEGERLRLEQDYELELRRMATSEGSDFRKFVLDYEGRAEDVPRIILIFRSAIRPLFTIMVGYFDYLFFNGGSGFPDGGAELLGTINLIVLGFWFGERAIVKSGAIEKMAALFKK